MAVGAAGGQEVCRRPKRKEPPTGDGSRATMALRMQEGAGFGVSGDLFASTPFTSAERGEGTCAD